MVSPVQVITECKSQLVLCKGLRALFVSMDMCIAWDYDKQKPSYKLSMFACVGSVSRSCWPHCACHQASVADLACCESR